MANKKTKPKETTDYDLTKAIKELETTEQLKKGFEYYINHNQVNIKDNNTLNKEFTKYIKGEE